MTEAKPCNPVPLPATGSDMGLGIDMDVASLTSSGEDTVAFKSFPSENSLYGSRAPSEGRLLESHATLAGELPTWSAQHSRELYNVTGWGCGYYGITESGDFTVHPLGGTATRPAVVG